LIDFQEHNPVKKSSEVTVSFLLHFSLNHHLAN